MTSKILTNYTQRKSFTDLISALLLILAVRIFVLTLWTMTLPSLTYYQVSSWFGYFFFRSWVLGPYLPHVIASDGHHFHTHIVRASEDHHEADLANTNPNCLKLMCSINDNQYKDVITCSNLVNFMNKDDEDIVGSFIWVLHIMVHSHTEWLRTIKDPAGMYDDACSLWGLTGCMYSHLGWFHCLQPQAAKIFQKLKNIASNE